MDEVNTFLQSDARALPRRIWMHQDKVGPRAEGLFVFDIAIDLRRLFKVSMNQHDPELEPKKIEELKADGWQESADGLSLICPKERREEIIPALAHALVNWRVTSNQSRTYSPQTTLALALSNSANRLANIIRADLREDTTKPKADPILDENVDGADLFVSLAAKGYVSGVTGDPNAMDAAEKALQNRLAIYNYDA